jgi:hypothetical protein
MITSLLPAWLEARICLRLRQHGLNPVYLVQCLFLLFPLFLCVEYGCAVVDEKDHTIGAIHPIQTVSAFLVLKNYTVKRHHNHFKEIIKIASVSDQYQNLREVCVTIDD